MADRERTGRPERRHQRSGRTLPPDGARPLIAVDTNILVYAHRQELPEHDAALAALTSLAIGSEAWALPVFVLGEFLRVVTHPNVFDPPTKEAVAVDALTAIVSTRRVRLLVPGDDYWSIFASLVVRHRVRGNLVHDAQIAAVCLEQGASTLLTEDRDFERFAGISIRPLSTDG